MLPGLRRTPKLYDNPGVIRVLGNVIVLDAPAQLPLTLCCKSVVDRSALSIAIACVVSKVEFSELVSWLVQANVRPESPPQLADNATPAQRSEPKGFATPQRLGVPKQSPPKAGQSAFVPSTALTPQDRMSSTWDTKLAVAPVWALSEITPVFRLFWRACRRITRFFW
jgi:hypothetical protein